MHNEPRQSDGTNAMIYVRRSEYAGASILYDRAFGGKGAMSFLTGVCPGQTFVIVLP
jgi:hypothetical protein